MDFEQRWNPKVCVGKMFWDNNKFSSGFFDLIAASCTEFRVAKSLDAPTSPPPPLHSSSLKAARGTALAALALPSARHARLALQKRRGGGALAPAKPPPH